MFKQFFDLILAIPNFFSTIGDIIRLIFAAAWPTTGNFIIRLWKFLLRALKTGFLLFINGILVLGILFLGVVFYFLITGLEYHGMDFSLIFPGITTRGVVSCIIFLLLLLSAAV